MLPLALVSLLEEGLVFFRRVLSLYNTFNKVREVADAASSLLDSDLRRHRNVFGEEVYLFVLGRETIKRVVQDSPLSQPEIDALVLYSLYQSVENRSSPDAHSTIIDYAHFLGQTFQIELDDFNDRCSSYLNGGDGKFVLADPVLSFIQSNDAVLPGPTETVFTSLGVDPSRWSAIVASIKEGSAGISWVNALENMASQNIKPHKMQTFLGLILRGAISVAQEPPEYAQVTGGHDGLYLSTTILSRPEPMIQTRERLSDVRGITKEMIDTASIRSMIAKGYVQLDNREWIHITQTEAVVDDEGNTSYRRAGTSASDSTAPYGATNESNARIRALSSIENIISKTIAKQAKGHIEDFGAKIARRLASKFQKASP